MNKKGILGRMIGGFVVIVVGVSLLPTIAEQVEEAMIAGNMSSSSETVLGLTTLFFALALAGIAIWMAWSGLRDIGLIGRSKEDDEEDDEDDEDEDDEDEDDEDDDEESSIIKKEEPEVRKEYKLKTVPTEWERTKFEEKSKYD